MMSRQHYVLLANILRNVTDITLRLKFAKELIPTLQKDNPRFNEKTFRKAADALINNKGHYESQ